MPLSDCAIAQSGQGCRYLLTESLDTVEYTNRKPPLPHPTPPPQKKKKKKKKKKKRKKEKQQNKTKKEQQ